MHTSPHLRRSLSGTLPICLLIALPIALWASLSLPRPAHAEPPNPAAERLLVLEVRHLRVQAEVADDPDSRARGLMFRESLPPDNGMVFVFDEPQRICMWMKNTFVPLTVAFINEEGKILNFADMRPQSLEPHCSAGPARYALEMNQGWFHNRGIPVGQQIKGLPGLPAKGLRQPLRSSP